MRFRGLGFALGQKCGHSGGQTAPLESASGYDLSLSGSDSVFSNGRGEMTKSTLQGSLEIEYHGREGTRYYQDYVWSVHKVIQKCSWRRQSSYS